MNQKLILFAFFLTIIGCRDKPTVVAEEKDIVTIPSFDWLVGDWKRTNDVEEGQQTYEQWQKKSALYYNGIGYTMVAADTVWKENIILFENDQDWYFSVKGMQDSVATNFLLTQIDKKSFQCQNVENPFPKMIEYNAVGDNLEAKISGGGDEILFVFSKN